MRMNPEHRQTGPSMVVPHSNYTVIANLCWGQQCRVAIKSQSRHLQRKHEAHISKLNRLVRLNRLLTVDSVYYSIKKSLKCFVLKDFRQSHPTHGRRPRLVFYLVIVSDKKSLLMRGHVHRDNNCMTGIDHRITRFGPQGLRWHKVQLLFLFLSTFYAI